MDIGGSAPRMYTLETMKRTGTLVAYGMYIRSIRRYITSYVPVTRYQIVYMLCDFIPDHHRGGPEIATKTTITIRTTIRVTGNTWIWEFKGRYQDGVESKWLNEEEAR